MKTLSQPQTHFPSSKWRASLKNLVSVFLTNRLHKSNNDTLIFDKLLMYSYLVFEALIKGTNKKTSETHIHWSRIYVDSDSNFTTRLLHLPTDVELLDVTRQMILSIFKRN